MNDEAIQKMAMDALQRNGTNPLTSKAVFTSNLLHQMMTAYQKMAMDAQHWTRNGENYARMWGWSIEYFDALIDHQEWDDRYMQKIRPMD